MENHQEAVATLAELVESYNKRDLPFAIYHGSTNCTRQITLDPSRIIDTSGLNNVISVDIERAVALVEPNVPMDSLIRETLRHRLIPPVIPELPGITVGVAFAGTAGESSSWKHGYFDRTVKSIEIILANGKISKAFQDGDLKDLFNAASGSYGTMGVLTLLEIELVPAMEYVELTYIPVSNAKDALATIKSCTDDKENIYDFVDAIQFSAVRGVVCVGHMTDICSHTLQRFLGPWDPWFYKHAENQAASGTRDEAISDTIPLRDYLFRYDRGAFWMGQYYPLFALSCLNNKLSRWFFDPFLHTRVLFQSMHLSNRSQRFIIQDLGLPQETAQEFLANVDHDLGIYPLWLCPIKAGTDVNFQRVKGTDQIINIGVWGPGSSDFWKFVDQNRALEHKLGELGGVKWLYAHTYFTPDEFWKLYDKSEYEAVRKKYYADKLTDIYKKVKSVEVDQPKQDLKATWHGFCAHFLGYDVPYLLSKKDT